MAFPRFCYHFCLRIASAWKILPVLVLPGLFFAGCGEKITPQYDPLPSAVDEILWDVQFVTPDTGYAVGGQRFKQDRLLRTFDGGNNWENLPSVFGQSLFGLQFMDSKTGFATGLGGKILSTTDGGSNWRVYQLRHWFPMHAIAVVNDSLLVAVGGQAYGRGQIVRSTNFGASWYPIDTFPYEFRDVVFTDSKVGYACGFSVIFKTIDGGESWDFTPAEGEFFSAMSFPEPHIGYAVGRTGTILKTRDAGATWKRLRNGSSLMRPRHYYNDVVFLSANVGYIVGDNGMVRKTTDGGLTWKNFERMGKEDIYAISLLEEGYGYISGENGQIVRFEE